MKALERSTRTLSINKRSIALAVLVLLLSFTRVAANLSNVAIRLDTAGTLVDKIDPSLKDSVVSLRLEGYINSADILLIREMAGADKDGKPTTGRLAHLDLSKAHIREGGGFYYLYYPAMDDYIKDCLFYRCQKLVSVILPESAVFMGNSVFGYCSNLEAVTIPKGIGGLGLNVFQNCQRLKSIQVNEENPALASENGVLFNKTFTSLKLYPPMKADSVYSMPSTLTSIEAESFRGNALIQAVVMPQGVTTMGMAAFQSCLNLQSITFSEKLTTIPVNAFTNCRRLEAIDLPYRIQSIGEKAFSECVSLASVYLPPNLTAVGNQAFYGCNSLKTLSFPSGVSSMGQGVLSGCKGLKHVVLPSSLANVPKQCFFYCLGLESITLPEGLQGIGDGAFAACWNLEYVSLPEGLTSIGYQSFAGCEKLSELVLPTSLTTISAEAFMNCIALEQLSLPKALAVIDVQSAFRSSPFKGCAALSAFYVDPQNAHFQAYEGVLYDKEMTTLVAYPNQKGDAFTIPAFVRWIGNCAFEGTSVRSVVFSDFVERVGQSAFKGCSHLERLVLNCVVDIDRQAFSGCSSLYQVSMPFVETIGFHAFERCAQLDSVKVPDQVTRLDGTFSNCSNLRFVELGARVDTVTDYTFSQCINLRRIQVNNPFPPVVLNTNAFLGVDLDSCVLSVPTGCTRIYRWYTVWSLFSHIAEAGAVPVVLPNPDELPLVTVADGRVCIARCPQAGLTYVYALSGRLVAVMHGAGQTKRLPKGVYLVVAPGGVIKVVV